MRSLSTKFLIAAIVLLWSCHSVRINEPSISVDAKFWFEKLRPRLAANNLFCQGDLDVKLKGPDGKKDSGSIDFFVARPGWIRMEGPYKAGFSAETFWFTDGFRFELQSLRGETPQSLYGEMPPCVLSDVLPDLKFSLEPKQLVEILLGGGLLLEGVSNNMTAVTTTFQGKEPAVLLTLKNGFRQMEKIWISTDSQDVLRVEWFADQNKDFSWSVEYSEIEVMQQAALEYRFPRVIQFFDRLSGYHIRMKWNDKQCLITSDDAWKKKFPLLPLEGIPSHPLLCKGR